MCLAFGVEKLDDVARKLSDVLEMQPPTGLIEKVRGLQKLKSIADSLPQHRSRKGACQEIVLRGDEVDLGLLPIQRCWPGDPAPFITLPAVITRDPRDGTRNVGMYRMQVIDRATTFMHWQIHKDGRADWLATRRADPGRGRARPRPDHRVLGERAAAEAHRRAHARRLPARRAGRARARASPSTSRCPRTRRSCSRATSTKDELGDEGPVRRPHRLLHGGRAVPRLPRHRDDDAARRDLSVDRRRQAAAGGRVARQGDGAHLPAGGAHDPARDRRLRPADRGRVPQLLHRLDPKVVPGPGAEGDARVLGPRDAQPDEVHRRRRRRRGRPRLRSRSSSTRARTSIPRATSSSARARPTTSTTRRSASS